jgi:glycosyltransferase involved in cell wall biosynthesis
MRIAIDGRALTGAWRFRGIANYTKNIIRALQELGYSPILYSWPCSEFDTNYEINFFGSKNYVVWENINLPIRLYKDSIDLVILPLNTGPVLYKSSKKVLVVHDLIAFNRDIKLTFQNLYKRWNLKLQKKNQIYLFVSETIKYDFSNQFHSRKNLNVLTNVFIPVNQSDIAIKEIENYIFSISGTSETKNLNRLIESYLLYIKKGGNLNLYVLGVDLETQKKYKLINLGIKNKIKFINTGVSSAHLDNLYQNSSLFIFISTQEGFGIPLLEALQYNKPIVRSNIMIFNEIMGDLKYNCSPFNINEISDSIILAENEKYILNDTDKSKIYEKYSFSNFKNKLNIILNG